jgi:hypothetical protein
MPEPGRLLLAFVKNVQYGDPAMALIRALRLGSRRAQCAPPRAHLHSLGPRPSKK